MRIIKIVIAVILLIIITSVVGFYIFLKTVDLNQFRDQITEGISRAVGREVAMRHVSFKFTVTKGVTLNISGLSVKDLPQFSNDPMLYIDSAHLDVDVLPLILKKQILVSKIEFDSPSVNIIRDAQGKINIQEFSANKDQKKSAETEEPDTLQLKEETAERNDGNEDFAFSEMLIRSIRIGDGSFTFTDHMSEPSMRIPVKDVTLDITNFSLNVSFPFRLEGSVFSKRRNIKLNGLAQVNAKNAQVRVDDLKFSTDFSDLLIDQILKEIPSFKEAGLSDGIKGTFTIDGYQMIFGRKGLLVLSADAQLADVEMSFEDSPVPVKDLDMRFAVSESDLEIKEMRMPWASGEIRGAGRLVEYLAEQKYFMDLVINNVQLSELAEQMKFPVKLDGLLQAKGKVDGRGLSGPKLISALDGRGASQIENGKVIDVNVLKLVLSKLSFVPDLANKIEENLPEKYKEKLRAKDTVLEKVEMDVKVHGGELFLNRVEVNADGFLALASGKMDFDQNLNLQADLYIPSDLSASLVAVSEELRYLLDENRRIHIPFKPYSGKASKFIMYPDVEDLGKEIIRNRGKEELKKVIFKALDIDKEEGAVVDSSSQDGQEAPSQKREPRPEEIIIDNIFDMIPVFE